MKLVIFALLLAANLSFGLTNPFPYRLDTSSTNLPATYPTSPQFTGPATAFAAVDFCNGSSSEIEVNCSATSSPLANAVGAIHIPASTCYSTRDLKSLITPLGNQCWFRSFSGTISSGVIIAEGYGY